MLTQRERRLSRSFHVGVTWAFIMIGTNTSAAPSAVTPANPGRVTPTMVMTVVLRVRGCPSTPGLAPKRRVQKSYPSITTGCPPGMRSSSGDSARPRNGPTPRTSKVLPEIISTETRSGSALPARAVAAAGARATMPENTPVLSRRSWYIGYENVRAFIVRPLKAPGPSSWTSSSGWATGSLRRRSWSVSEKMAVLAPIPRPSVRTTTRKKPGARVRVRTA